MEHDDDTPIIELGQIGGEPVAYSDTEKYYPAPKRPEGEITLRWLDRSVLKIQVRRPPGWRYGDPETRAEGFYDAIQQLLWEMFNGQRGGLIEVFTDEEEGTYFVTSGAPE